MTPEFPDLEPTTVSLALTGLWDSDPIGTASLLQQIEQRLFGAPGSIELGHYRLLQPIGSGGFATVYAAHDPRLDRRVAIKLLHQERAASAPELLLREAQAMARLSHVNVVTVHDVGTYDLGDGRGGLFVVMELVDGETLSQWLAARPPWPAVVERFAAAGRGLAAAHAIGLVHRDFKPGNVLIGRDGRVCVADFGLARAASETGERERERAGTPLYMAPEQLAGDAPVGPAADQFAFCVALFEALHGRQPFPVAQLPARLQAIRARALAPVPEDSEVPARLQAAIARGLDPEPQRRHADMQELLRALEPAVTPGVADVAAIRARIHVIEPGVIRYHELPVITEFTIQVMRAELTRLTIDGAPYALVVELDEANMPGPEVRHHIVRMFADRHLNFVALLTHGDPVKELTANLIVSQVVARERFEMFESEAAALAACRAALAGAR